jgi:hypothetical protein
MFVQTRMYIKRIPCKLGISTFALQTILMIANRTLVITKSEDAATFATTRRILVLLVCSTELRGR